MTNNEIEIDSFTRLDRLADAAAEVERLQAVVKQRDRDLSSAIVREGEAREREQDITEALDDLKREVGAEWVRLAEAHGWDMDVVERAIDHLDLEMPKQEPVTIEWTITVTATGTPTSRDVAKKLSDGYVDSVFVENLLLGAADLDVDESALDIDPWNGIHVSVDRTEVS